MVFNFKHGQGEEVAWSYDSNTRYIEKTYLRISDKDQDFKVS